MFHLLIILFLWHPLHLSITEVEYDDKAHALQIVCRIFIDDFESSIRQAHHLPELDLLNPGNGMRTKELVGDYLKRHFHIKLNNNTQTVKFLGYKEDGFILLCYLEVENVRSFTNIEIRNTAITELYEDQSNIVHINYKNTVRSIRLRRDHPFEELVFL